MIKIYSLLITFITGLLFLLGVVIIKKMSRKKEISEFSTAMAFSVILCLLILDIAPEIYEAFSYMRIEKLIINILGFCLIGIITLKLLDYFIPDHTHNHHDGEKNIQEHNSHMFHIGCITSIAIIIHNIIEGIAIYTIGISSLETALIMMVGVGLHNIPMGMEISVNLESSKKSTLLVVLLTLSTLFGGIIGLLFTNISSTLIGVFLSITAGMLIYIAFFELFKEIKNHIKSKYTIFGLLIGIVLMLLTIIL